MDVRLSMTRAGQNKKQGGLKMRKKNLLNLITVKQRLFDPAPLTLDEQRDLAGILHEIWEDEIKGRTDYHV